jgi:hypothetical protein
MRTRQPADTVLFDAAAACSFQAKPRSRLARSLPRTETRRRLRRPGEVAATHSGVLVTSKTIEL